MQAAPAPLLEEPPVTGIVRGPEWPAFGRSKCGD